MFKIMKYLLFLIVLISLNLNVSASMTKDNEFTQKEYKIIANIITNLTYNEKKDIEFFNNQTPENQLIWRAFKSRFAHNNPQKNNDYFSKIDYKKRYPGEYYTKFIKQILFEQKKEYSPIVVWEMLLIYEFKEKLNKIELDYIKNMFFDNKSKKLRRAAFAILLMYSDFFDNSSREVLDKLSKDEMESFLRYRAKKLTKEKNKKISKTTPK